MKINCMFVSQESLGANPKLHFFNDKELPKGNKSERLVSQFLELSCNPKGNSAYKYIFDMQEGNNFVTNSKYAKVTPTQESLNGLLDKLSETTKKFEIEKNIKNNLYFFILEQGLLEELKNYKRTTNLSSNDGHKLCVSHLLINSKSVA